MAFLARLLHGNKKKAVEPMHGVGASQTEEEQSATRQRMESEMASERARRAERAQQAQTKPPASKP